VRLAIARLQKSRRASHFGHLPFAGTSRISGWHTKHVTQCDEWNRHVENVAASFQAERKSFVRHLKAYDERER